MVADLGLQRVDPLFALFGVKYLELGIKKKDKDLNRRIALFKSWGKAIVDQKIEETKEKIKN